MVTGAWLRLLRYRQNPTTMRHVTQSRTLISSTTVRERWTVAVGAGDRSFGARLIGPASGAVVNTRHRGTTAGSGRARDERPRQFDEIRSPAVRQFEWTRAVGTSVLRLGAQHPPTARFAGRARNDAEFSFGLIGDARRAVVSSSSLGRAPVTADLATSGVLTEGLDRARPATTAMERPDIERLTDKVVAALDRRLWAQRERMGGR